MNISQYWFRLKGHLILCRLIQGDKLFVASTKIVLWAIMLKKTNKFCCLTVVVFPFYFNFRRNYKEYLILFPCKKYFSSNTWKADRCFYPDSECTEVHPGLSCARFEPNTYLLCCCLGGGFDCNSKEFGFVI